LVVDGGGFRIPLEFRSFREIWIMQNVVVSGDTLHVLAKYGKVVYILGRDGVSSVLLPLSTRWFIRGDIAIAQTKKFLISRIVVGKRIVEGIIRNIKLLLDYLSSKNVLDRDTVSFAKRYVNRALERLDNARNVNDIVSCEAEAWNALYTALSERFSFFEGRIKRPPTDPLNALISYFNSILYGIFIRFILKAGLEPTVSFVHSPYGYKRFALAFDLKDIFAPATSVRHAIMTVNRFYRKGILEESFSSSSRGCYLRDPYRTLVVRRFFENLKRKVKGYSYLTWMYKECIKFREFITGNRTGYDPWLWKGRFPKSRSLESLGDARAYR